MLALKPMPGRILVELSEKYDNVVITAQKYDTKTTGICLDFRAPIVDSELWSILYNYDLIGKLVFWEEYKNGSTIERDGKQYAFVKVEDIEGFEDV